MSSQEGKPVEVIPVLCLSIFFQLIAAFLALRLIPVTGRWKAWLLVFAALFVMAIRRIITLIQLVVTNMAYPFDIYDEALSLIISILMMYGMVLISPLFLSIKRSSEALRESEERLRTLINAMPDFVCFRDGEGRWLEVNDVGIRLFQLERIDYKGKKGSKLAEASSIYRQVFPSCRDTDEKAWEQGNLSRSEEIISLADDTNKVYEVIKVPLFQQDGKRKGLVILGRDITENKQAEERLKASLQEKEVLLKEIHHRVNNNLQIVSSLLNLQSGYIQNQEFLEMLRDSQNRIRSIALVHEKLYQSNDLANIKFSEYVRNLLSYLFRSYGVDHGTVQTKLDIDDVPLEIDTIISCGLIINELVSNSLKHAFPENSKGDICVALHPYEDQFMLAVSDNGIGLPQDMEIKNTESLGLKLVTALVEEIKGTLEFHSNGGLQFKIVLKKSGIERKD
jgi:PAS domain S-box-containing protein